MILLDAVFINNSGGKILLDYLVEKLHQSEKDIFYLLDRRVKGDFDYLPPEKVLYLPNSLLKRHRFYKANTDKFSTVLCFGNIPPSIRLKAIVFTYFHKTTYFYTSNAFSFKKRWISRLKAAIITSLKKNTDKWWVQTNEVKRQFDAFWDIQMHEIEVLPFYPSKANTYIRDSDRETNSFLYVSDGHPNKLHLHLLNAMKELYKTTPNIKLYLTVSSQYPVLLDKIKELKQQGLKIENLGWCDNVTLDKFYRKSGFFIYPSNQESFGLGLIEAAQYKMKILASDLPFIHEVIEPSLVFQAQNELAIAEAMKLALESNLKKARLLTSDQLELILDKLE